MSDVIAQYVIRNWERGSSVRSIAAALVLTDEDVGHILQHRPRVLRDDSPPHGGHTHYRNRFTCPWCHANITGTTETQPHYCDR